MLRGAGPWSGGPALISFRSICLSSLAVLRGVARVSLFRAWARDARWLSFSVRARAIERAFRRRW